jgi:hypothetical protein
MTLQTLPANLELPVLQPKRKPNRYGPNNPPPGKGRTKGAINKITADLKQGILRGAATCGYDGEGLGGVDGFLLMCAQRYPKHYLTLLGKMLPLNLNADVNTSTASISEIRMVSVPSDHYFIPEAGDSPSEAGTFKHIPPLEPLAPIERAEPAQYVAPEPAPIEQPADDLEDLRVVVSAGLKARRALRMRDEVS